MCCSKKMLSLMVLAISCLFVAFTALASNQNLEKAKKLMKAKMYNEAITLLEQELYKSPDNSDLHWNLGLCYFNNKRYSEADTRFISATNINKKLSPKVAQLFKNIGSESLDNNRIYEAYDQFKCAARYQPSLIPVLSNQLVKKAQIYVSENRKYEAQIAFGIASDLDDGVKIHACNAIDKILFEQPDKTYLNQLSFFYSRCKNHEESIAKRLLGIANSATEYDPEMTIEAASTCSKIRPDFNDEVSKVYLELATREYAQGRIQTFKAAMKLYNELNPYVEPIEDRAKALLAINLIELNERKRGIRKLKELTNSDDIFAKTVSNYVLADPEVGFIIVDKKTTEEYGNFLHSIKKVLRKVEFTSGHKLKLHLELTNITNDEVRVYFIKEKSDYVVDNNGNKLYYLAEEIDKSEMRPDLGGYLVNINKGETINYTVTVGMVSQGATSISIIDQNSAGDEFTFRLDNIAIKKQFNSPDKIVKTTYNKSDLPISSGSIFVGNYICNNEHYPYKLYVKSVRNNTVYGVFEYQLINSPKGSFSVQGKYVPAFRRIVFEPKQWISQPIGHFMDKFDVTVSPDGKSLVGVGDSTSCSVVRLDIEDKINIR